MFRDLNRGLLQARNAVGTLLSTAFLVALMVCPSLALLSRRAPSGGWIGGIVLYPAAELAHPTALLELASKDDGLVLLSREARQASLVYDQARKISGTDLSSQRFLAIFEAEDHTLHVVCDAARISQIVGDRASQQLSARRPTWIWLVGLIGFALGFVGRRRLLALLPMGFAVESLLASLLYAVRCRTCPTIDVGLFGLNPALLGTFLFGGLAIVGSLDSLGGHFRLLSCAVLPAVGTWQIVAFLHAESVCAVCCAIFFINSSLIGSLGGDATGHLGVFRKPALLASVGAISLAMCSFATPHPRATIYDLHLTQARNLVGSNIDRLGIVTQRGPLKVTGPTTLLVASPDCAPCRLATLWAASRPELKVVFVRDSAPTIRSRDVFQDVWMTATASLDLPTFIVIDRRGVIIAQVGGWSDSKAFQDAVFERLVSALAPQQGVGRKQ